MKTKLLKNSVKAIKHSFKRYISIVLMAFLGVGFFSGLVATGPDMRETLDLYYDAKNVYDISIISTLGLTDSDIEELKKIEDIEDVYGVNSKDQIVEYSNEKYIAKFIELNENINDVDIAEGRRPENEDECLIDNFFLDFYSVDIGDTIKTEEKEYKIVGRAKSPLYITTTRGTTNIGSGSLDFFVYVNKIDQDYYTNIYLTVKNAKELTTGTKKYDEIVENAEEKIEEIKEARQQARYDEIRKEAEDEINSAKQELDESMQDANQKLQDAKNQIQSGERQLTNAKNQINKNKNDLETNRKNAETQFAQAEAQLKNNEDNLNKAKEGLNQAESGLETINTKLIEIESNLKQLNETKEKLDGLGQDTTEIQNQILLLQSTKSSLNVEKQSLEKQITNLKNTISQGEAQLTQARKDLESSKNTANNQMNEFQKQINDAEKQIKSNENTINQNKAELQEQETEMNTKFDEAKKEIEDAEKELEKIEKPTWYITLRDGNSGYATYIDSVNSMVNVAKLFPLVFYIIAILTSLTSMTRMVEEERTEIGTLKALGYKNSQILSKYVIYSLSACITGGIIGMLIGFKALPNIIWTIYKIMFDMNNLTAPYRIDIGIIGLGIAILCIVGATIYTCMSKLRNVPAKLMRPKPPKLGKRIALERVTFIWKKLKFSQKVTCRNIFRYKKRAIMTIVGITGCTALILAGFGLKDSVTGIIPYQYGEIFNYKEIVSLKDNKLDGLEKFDHIETNMKSVSIEDKEANLMVATENINEVIKFYNKKTNTLININDDGVLITDKLADLLNIKEQDEITFMFDEKEYTLKVTNIVKNYIHNYIYISKPLYEQNIGEYETNTIIIKNQLSDEEKQEILNNENVLSLMDVNEVMSGISDMLNSLNYVILVLLVSAALLAFVVLYNLANVNIGERIREIATLKVLGFYDKEVDNYINKETRILTAIGIILGLFAGYVLCNFLIATCEVEIVRFVKEIKPISYVYAVVITTIFTFLVNLIVHKTLKKVDMIESLKSVE